MTFPSRLRFFFMTAICGAVVLTACSGNSTSGPQATSVATSTSVDSNPATTDAGVSSTDTSTSTSSTTTTLPPPVPPPDNAVMQLSFQFAPTALWSDGSPLSADDVACTVDALKSTPGSAEAELYRSIIEVRPGRIEGVVEVFFDRAESGHRMLFDRLVQASLHEDCSDLSMAFDSELPTSAGPLRAEVWNSVQMILEPVARDGEPELGFDRVVLVPLNDVSLEVDLLRSGEVDIIAPDLAVGVGERLDDPNLSYELQGGGRVEVLYLQPGHDPEASQTFADDLFRDAFWRSFDRDRVVLEVYDPIRPGIDAWTCGPTLVEEWCVGDDVADGFDPGGAALDLTAAGWTQDSDGYWQDPSGEPHEIIWLIDAVHARQRELADAIVPMMAERGFRIRLDECGAGCVVADEMAAMDFDMTIFASADPPDVGAAERRFSCDEIPSASEGRSGRNITGFCDVEADVLLDRATSTFDVDEQAAFMSDVFERTIARRHVLPLVRLPSALAWRPDKVGPESVLRRIRSTNSLRVSDLAELVDLDGDGQLVIGVETWPGCENPIVACGSDGWYRQTVGALVVPGLWELDTDRQIVPSPLLRRAAYVTMLER